MEGLRIPNSPSVCSALQTHASAAPASAPASQGLGIGPLPSEKGEGFRVGDSDFTLKHCLVQGFGVRAYKLGLSDGVYT